MGRIILFPTNENYCKECVYYNGKTGICKNDKYNKNSYEVNCVLKYCKYKKLKN